MSKLGDKIKEILIFRYINTGEKTSLLVAIGLFLTQVFTVTLGGYITFILIFGSNNFKSFTFPLPFLPKLKSKPTVIFLTCKVSNK